MKLVAPRQGNPSLLLTETGNQVKRRRELVEVDTSQTKAERVTTAFRPTKKVSFFPQVLVQYVLHVADYSPQEYFDSWYDRFEYKEQRDDIRMTLRMMESSGADTLPENVWYSTRGLEGRTVLGSRAKKNLRQAALNAVFKAQAELSDESSTSSLSSAPSIMTVDVQDEIARAYSRVSAASTLEAHARAVKDSFHVRDESLSRVLQSRRSGPLTRQSSSAKVFISSTAA